MAKFKTVLLSVVALLSVPVLLYWPPCSQCLEFMKMKQFVESRKNMYTEVNTSKMSPSLPVLTDMDISQLVATVKKFVFFVGYARSGHSIIGSLMDAHPHVVTSNEFFLFSHFHELDRAPDRDWKKNLFDLLYNKSVKDAERIRANTKKGYTLAVEGQWQGSFDKYIEIIGDKSGGETTITYMKDKEAFKRNYEKLEREVSIPIRIIHAVRNPFDIISTKYIYTARRSKDNHDLSKSELYAALKEKTSDGTLRMITSKSFKQFSAVGVMIEEVFGRENVLEVHNCDLVDNPRATISRIFQFLEVDTSEQYLDACAAKVFKSVSRSRDALEWSPKLIKMVEEKMKAYEKMFNRYSFTSD